MNKTLFLMIVCTILSCAKEKEINQKFGNISTELIGALEVINKSQVFEINPSQPNTVVGKSGTILIIPENSIVDQNGNVVSKNIFIEIKENFTKSDFITANLQTIHNDKILESLGMVFLSANDKNGNELKIATGKSIRLQIPQKRIKKDAKIFLGNRDNNGLINWDKIEEPSKSLTPYPIKFISNEYRGFTECLRDYGITTDTINRDYNYYGNITDFENSILATKEFSERYYNTCWDSVIDIYIKNLDKNLWEIDEMVVDFFIKDSIDTENYFKNNPPPKVNGKEITKVQWNAHYSMLNDNRESYGWYIKTFKEFAKLKLTKVDTLKLVEPSKLDSLNKVLITYDAMDFGWINVDYFYKDPKSEPIKLIAKTNKTAEIINLIIKDRSVILSGFEKTSNEYWFTKNQDGYNKLPKGEKGIIMAIGFNQNGVTFGEKEIIIGDDEIENIVLENVSAGVLKSILEKYGS